MMSMFLRSPRPHDSIRPLQNSPNTAQSGSRLFEARTEWEGEENRGARMLPYLTYDFYCAYLLSLTQCEENLLRAKVSIPTQVTGLP